MHRNHCYSFATDDRSMTQNLKRFKLENDPDFFFSITIHEEVCVSKSSLVYFWNTLVYRVQQ